MFVLCYADKSFHLVFEVFRCCVLNVKVISVDVWCVLVLMGVRGNIGDQVFERYVHLNVHVAFILQLELWMGILLC